MAATILNDVTTPTNAIAFTKVTGWGTPVTVNGVIAPLSGSRMVILYAEQDFTINHEGAAPTAAYRIITPDGSPYPLLTGQSAILVYDTEVSRWRVVSTP